MPEHTNIKIPGGEIIAETLLRILRYDGLNKALNGNIGNDPVKLIDSLITLLGLNYKIPADDLKNIPAEGPFITISNHPYRGVDSMLLYKIISEKRKDFRVMASHLLKEVDPLKDIVIPISTYDPDGKKKGSFQGIKEAIVHLREGHCIGMFPAGEDESQMEVSRIILDQEWQTAAIKFIRNAGVPVIPVYFHGTSSRVSYISGKIHPILQFEKLPRELLYPKNSIVRIRSGSAITAKEQSVFRDTAKFGRYLRTRTYILGSALEVKSFFPGTTRFRLRRPQPLADPRPERILLDEFTRVKKKYELFSTKNYSVVCAPTMEIPSIFAEIGRLRELTFRKVGEGTNKSIDIDEYDFYFNHLFIWDTEKNRIVGAYRIGKGKEIISIYGINGFYISSLFRIKSSFAPVLGQSIELGRSFITEEYQKKAFSLFLLWKGIMVFLLRNPEYRYLIGPVSISNDFSKFSKNLIVSFIRKYFMDEHLAGMIIPRKDFIVTPGRDADPSVFVEDTDNDINRIEKLIMDIEPGYRLPVLLKKYLEINGKIIGFNVDPKFNYCLDGLLILDLYKTPPGFIRGLSRELDDPSILERFSLREETEGSA